MRENQNYHIPEDSVPPPLLEFRTRSDAPKSEKNPSSLCFGLFLIALLLVGLWILMSLGQGPPETVPVARGFVDVAMVTEQTAQSETSREKVIRPTCLTENCQKLVDKLHSMIKPEVSPCDDFYKHACGNYRPDRNETQKLDEAFERETEIAFAAVAEFLKQSSSKSLLPSESVLQKVYWKCEAAKRDQKAAIDHLRDDLRLVFGWPTNFVKANEKVREKGNFEEFRVQNLMAKILKMNPNSLPFFQIQGHRKTLQIEPAFCEPDYAPIDKELVRRVFQKLNDNNDAVTQEWMEETLGYALKIDEKGVECSKTVVANHVITSAEELDMKTSRVDFVKILKEMTDAQVENHRETILKQTFFVDAPQFFGANSSINEAIRLDAEGVSNYLVIKFIESFGENEENLERTDCAKIVSNMLPRASLSIYVNHFLRNENLIVIPHLIGRLKSEFGRMIETNGWLNSSTKSAVAAKIRSFETDISAPGTPEKEDRVLEALQVTERDSFYTVFTRLNEFWMRTAMEYVLGDQEISLEEERLEPKANYNMRVDPTKLLAPMIADPLFDANFPPAVQYAKGGSVIGHEIAHLVNPRDRKRRLDTDTWQQWSIEEFDIRSQCLVSTSVSSHSGKMKYSAYRQLLADYLGLVAAWKAYQAETSEKDVRLTGLGAISDNQLFFYSYVQMKCEKKERFSFKQREPINGILSQLSAFAPAFECPLGSAMNPSNKCAFFEFL
ncbi:unnamed protein product [Caenorhabditis sp. 36 PRJEB53466]|nr:unnamed protein product [Caenorhabditis sp. 36 PRJEB53466]